MIKASLNSVQFTNKANLIKNAAKEIFFHPQTDSLLDRQTGEVLKRVVKIQPTFKEWILRAKAIIVGLLK